MANNTEEQDRLALQFVEVHVRLQLESSKLDSLMFNEMAECKVLFNEISAPMEKDKDIVSVFDEQDKRISKISKNYKNIKVAYTEFECLLLKVLCANTDMSTIAERLKQKIDKNDGWFVQVKRFLNGEESLKVLAEINKVMETWKGLKIKQQLEECKADMKALLADVSRDFIELWTGSSM